MNGRCIPGYEYNSEGICVQICGWGEISDGNGGCTPCQSPLIPDYDGVSDMYPLELSNLSDKPPYYSNVSALLTTDTQSSTASACWAAPSTSW